MVKKAGIARSRARKTTRGAAILFFARARRASFLRVSQKTRPLSPIFARAKNFLKKFENFLKKFSRKSKSRKRSRFSRFWPFLAGQKSPKIAKNRLCLRDFRDFRDFDGFRAPKNGPKSSPMRNPPLKNQHDFSRDFA